MQSWRLAKGFAMWTLLVTPFSYRLRRALLEQMQHDLAALKAQDAGREGHKPREEAKLLLERMRSSSARPRCSMTEAAVESAGQVGE